MKSHTQYARTHTHTLDIQIHPENERFFSRVVSLLHYYSAILVVWDPFYENNEAKWRIDEIKVT